MHRIEPTSGAPGTILSIHGTNFNVSATDAAEPDAFGNVSVVIEDSHCEVVFVNDRYVQHVYVGTTRVCGQRVYCTSCSPIFDSNSYVTLTSLPITHHTTPPHHPTTTTHPRSHSPV